MHRLQLEFYIFKSLLIARMIIDAHHHLWKFSEEDYGWISDTMSLLKKDYLPADIEKELNGAGVSGTVVVQARQSLEETRWLLDLAGKHPFIKGVVGWVELISDRLEEQLDEFTPHSGLVGVRNVIQDEPDDDYMLRPAFMEGIEKLGKYGLTYDFLIFPKHLESAAELARSFPEQKFVLDHLAKPHIKEGILEPWREDIESLAAQPNAWCKVSGMVTEADWKNWNHEDFMPYLDIVVKAFSVDRLMLGSDWPVCLLAGDYREVMNIPVRYMDELDPLSREKVLRKNCIDFYELTNL
jgi:L-fuconolactonase